MSVWKACDIRGRYPAEVSRELFHTLGVNASTLLEEGQRVVVAGDGRVSTPELKTALIQGLVEGGLGVLDIGILPTPVAYFAHRQWQTGAIFVVTASHNPAEYNGLKLMIADTPPEESLMSSLQSASPLQRATGSVVAADIVPEYRAALLSRWKHVAAEFRGTIVTDAGNGAWSTLAPELLSALGFPVARLYCELDGTFPNRQPDCSKAANLAALRQMVQSTGARLGIAWDGDGDRVAFVDHTGRVATADQISILLSRYQLAQHGGGTIVYDIKLSDALRTAIADAGGSPIMERSGHGYLRRAMREHNGLLGCEVSGHYFHRELAGGDDGLFTALLMMELVSRRGDLAGLIDELPELFITPDIRLPLRIASYESVTERLRGNLAVLRTTMLDGLKFDTLDGTVLVRRSITEPVLTLRVDASGAGGYQRLMDACFHSLPEMESEIKMQIERSRLV